MSITINFLPRKKTTKERVWKGLNVIVAVTTLLNVSGAAIWFHPLAANAASVPNSLTVNGGASVTVAPNTSVTVAATVTTTSGTSNRWRGTEYRIGTGSWTCVDTANHDTAGTFTESFAVTSPASAGVYDLDVRTYSDSSCTSNQSAMLSLGKAITVETVTPVTNPPLGQSCGLDVALVVDTSGSVDSTEMGQMKTALTNFATAFTGTPTVFSLSSFNTDSVQNRAFSRTPAQIAADITSDIPSAGNGFTNWDSGLNRGNATFDPRPAKANLLVIATDGSPNHWGYPNNTGANDWTLGLQNAIPTANAIKTAGTRIVVVGIGEDTSDPATPAEKLDKMKAISGPTVATTPATITTATDVIKVTNFSGIGAALSAFANQLCGGKILVQKQFDTNGDGVADVTGNTPNALLSGYTFDVDGTPSNPAAQVTTNTGALEFSVLNGTYSLAELAVPAGTRVASILCVKGTQPIGTVNLQSGTVTGLTLSTDETISCTVINTYNAGSLKVTKVVSGGTATPDQFGFRLVGSNGAYTYPATGQNNVVIPNLLPGSYSVEETGPTGYHQTNTTCTGVQVTAGQQATCTITNTRDTGRVVFDKVVPGFANAEGQFIFHVNGQGAYHDGDAATLATGTYTVTEDAVAGYTFSSASGICSYNQGVITMAVTSNGGTCTITNTRDLGTLVVKKNVINPDGSEVVDTHSFGITVSGQANGAIAEGTDATYTNLPTGTYTVTELVDGNYTFVSYSLDADTNVAGAQVVVTKGQTTTVTVTNKQKKVEIIVHKNVVAYDGQTDVTDAHSFTASVNGVNGAISESQTFSTLVNPGNVTIGEQADANYTIVGITPNNFTVHSGDQAIHVTVTNKQKPSSVTGMKFNDVNGNGVKNAGDNGLANWTICLGVSTTAPNPTCVQTDGNGNYALNNLMPGNYQVWEVNQAGWLQTFPANNVHNVSVGVNASITGKDFGNFRLGKISGYKWNDLNGNGTWDNGEPTLPGWTINLTGPVNGSVVTNGSGFYEFTGLTVGQYTVTETQQNGWTQTSVSPAPINVVSGTNSQNNNFGNFGRGSISGQKFNDLNGNGTWDQGEPTIAGWTIYLNNGQNITSIQTNGSGVYTFANLGPGNYTVSENLITGWIQTFPPQAGTYLVTITSGAQITGKDFGNFALGKISGYKWNDLNGNGVWNQGEPTIAGWGLTLSNGQQQWNTLTDQSGYYEFTGLTAGTYSVTEETRAGWTAKTPTTIANIVVTSGVNSQNNNFGNFALGSISGSKFDDTNGNGVWNNGEPTLSGWTIQLDKDANGTIDATTITDGSGHYAFSGLNSGTYRIRESQQAGWTQTTVNPADAVIASGVNVTDVNFGNFKVPKLTVIKHVINNHGGTATADDFTMNVTGNDVSDPSFPGDENGTTVSLWAGDYSVDEIGLSGYAKTLGENCSGSVQSGSVVTCTITNDDIQPRLTVTKIVVNDNGGDKAVVDFPLFVGQTSVTSGNQNGFNAGDYVISETSDVNYSATIEGDCNPKGEITLGVGETKACTIINDDIAADLYVTKDGPATVQAGDQITYTINWNVIGPGFSANTTLVDTLPSNVTFVSASDNFGVTPSYNGTTVTWNLGDLTAPANGSETITVQTNDPEYNGTLVHNDVTFSSDDDESSDGHDTTILSDFEVSIDKVAPVTVESGANLVYTLNWTVGGNAPIDELVITDTLPANTTFVSASNGGTELNGTVTWNLGAQNADANGSVTLTVKVANLLLDGTIITNTGTVCGASAPSQREIDLKGIEHCDDDTTTTEVNSDFTVNVVKTDNIDPVLAGGQVTYTLAWSTTGNAPISNLVITDAIPANTTFVSASNGGTLSNGKVTWNLGPKTPGDFGSVTITLQAASPVANGTVITNIATVCGTMFTSQEQTVQHCDDDDETTTISSTPSISITKTNNVAGFTNPGKTVTYTVVVTNAANATDTARSVNLTDLLPTGFTFVDGGLGTKTFALGDIAPSASVTTTYVVNISASQAAGTYTNTASAQGSNTNKVNATSNVEVRLPQILGASTSPELTITKRVNPTVTNPGKIISYTVIVKNVGDADAENVVVTDTLPKGFTFVDGGKATKTWKLGTLEVNHERVLNYQVKVGENVKAGKYTNVAVVTADGMSEEARASVEVKVPKVLGLATTGASGRDYAFFLLGLSMIALGGFWMNRQRRSNRVAA